MIYYVLTKNNLLFGVTVENPYGHILDVVVHEFDGNIPDLNTHTWDQTTETIILSNKTISTLSFLNRFTVSERIGIRASTNPVVIDFIKLLDAVDVVSLTSADSINGVNYLVSLGLLAPTRPPEILN